MTTSRHKDCHRIEWPGRLCHALEKLCPPTCLLKIPQNDDPIKTLCNSSGQGKEDESQRTGQTPALLNVPRITEF